MVLLNSNDLVSDVLAEGAVWSVLYVQYIQSYYNEYIQVEDITFTEIENLKGAELLNPLFYGAEEFLTWSALM